MTKVLFATTALLGVTGIAPAAQISTAAGMDFNQKQEKGKPDFTYGRMKEFTAGQKIVIDVDNAPDKSFALNDKDVTVKVASGLKVGDPVRVAQRGR